MPTYEYCCEACGHTFEQFQSITADPLKNCPKCVRGSLQRLIGAGAGVIFRGAGFYETDYRSESYKKAEEAEKKAASAADAKPGSEATKSTDAAKPTEAKPPTESARPSLKPVTAKTAATPAKPAQKAAKPARTRGARNTRR